MAKLVRMTSAEYRAWNLNEPQLVTKEGVPVQPITSMQEVECAKVMALARKQEKTAKKEVVLKERDPETGKISSNKKITIEAKVMRTGQGTGEIQVFAFLDGLMRVTMRDIITARMFKAHGECQLVRPNGKFLKKVRDPQRVPSTKSPSQIAHMQQYQVPSPNNCPCKDWGSPHPGKHYPQCKYNDMAPPDQRGYAPGTDDHGRLIKNPGSEVRRQIAEASAPPVELVSPEDCACKSWQRSDPEKHANICQHKEAWESRGQEAFYLVEMGGSPLRKATQDEVAEGENVRASTGQALITVDGTICVLMSEKELSMQTVSLEVAMLHDGEEETATEDAATEESLAFTRPEDIGREMTGASEPYQALPEETAIGGGGIDKGGLPLAGMSL